MPARLAPLCPDGWGTRRPSHSTSTTGPASASSGCDVGTPPVLALTALDAALDVWDDVSIDDVRTQSIRLAEAFIREVEARCPELVLASPRDGERRGSQVSMRHPEGYAIMQALIARGVIGDFRAPDVVRFGFTPLYLSESDVMKAVDILQDIMANRRWDRPEFQRKALVT